MSKNSGFTLIELMIVVAIVAILAAVAVPSYQQFVLDGRRAEGVAFALDIASRQERNWTQNSTFAGDLTAAGLNVPDGDAGVAGIQSESGAYTATSTGGNTFTITLTPTFTDAECTTLTLNNIGVQGSTGTATADECWR